MSSDASATYIVAGPTGPVGPQGPQGERGLQGEQGNRGATGSIGPRGNSGTVSVGTVTTLPATGTDQDTLATATVTDVGTSSSAAVLNFGIPGGIRGPKGDPGSFSANVSDPTIGTTFSVDGSNGNTFIAGTLDVSKNVSFFSDLDVSGNVDVSGNLTVDGSFTLSNGTDSGVNTGALIISGGLYVGKKIYGGRKLTVATEGIDVLSGDVTMSNGNLDVAGSSTLRGNTSITGTNKFTVGTGATDLSGTLTVEQDTTLKSGLDVKSGALNVDNTTGLTTIGNNLVINGDVILGASSSNNITFKGDISSNIVPDVDATHNLGAPTLGWDDLYLGSGGVINFGNSNLNITHSNDRRLTLSSGSTIVAKAITATSIDSSGNITVPANSLVSFNGNQDTNEAIFGDGSYLYLRSGGRTFRVPDNITTDYFLKTDANGNLSWAVPTGGSSNTSTSATKFAITNNTSTDAEFLPVFVNSSSGNVAGTVDSTKLKYNPFTGTLTSSIFIGDTIFIGDLSGNATFATDISGGAANQIPFQTGSGDTTFSSDLTFNDSTNTLTVTNLSGNASSATTATTATHIANGAANQIPYQTGSGATSFSSGLTFNGTDTLTVTNLSGNASTATALNTSTNGIVKTTSGNGTLSIGALVSGDIPNNAANTSGTATQADKIEVNSSGTDDTEFPITFIGVSSPSTRYDELNKTNWLTFNPSGRHLTVPYIFTDGRNITTIRTGNIVNSWNGVSHEPLGTGIGGTGQLTYTDGQLLIGNSSNTLTKANLTAGSGISIINGNGSITIANSATSISVSGALTTDTGNYIVNAGSLTITLPTPSSTGNFLIIYTTSETYTLNNGNSPTPQTASVGSNTSTICIATGTSAGDWVAFASGSQLTFS